MPRIASTYRVFLASPGRMEKERETFFRVLRERNQQRAGETGAVFLPIRWEPMAPGSGQPQGRIIEDLIEYSDYMVVVFKDRIGAPIDGKGKAVSGTVKEFSSACDLIEDEDRPMKDVAVLFLPSTSRDKKLDKFKAELEKGRAHLVREVTGEEPLAWHLGNLVDGWERKHNEKCMTELAEKWAKVVTRMPSPTQRSLVLGYWLALGMTLLAVGGLLAVVQWLPDLADHVAAAAVLAVFSVLFALTPRPPKMDVPDAQPERALLKPFILWFERVSVTFLVTATALGMSLLSMIVTLFFPPCRPNGAPSDLEASPRWCLVIEEDRVVHGVFILIAVIVTAGLFSFIARARSPDTPNSEIAVRVGFFGILLSGLMGVAVSVPYTWVALESQDSAATGLHLGQYILILRLGVLPLVGLAVSLLLLRIFANDDHGCPGDLAPGR